MKKAKKKSSNAVMPMATADMDYRAESDCRTLRTAEEIRNDKNRHGAAKKHAVKEMNALSKVTGRDK